MVYGIFEVRFQALRLRLGLSRMRKEDENMLERSQEQFFIFYLQFEVIFATTPSSPAHHLSGLSMFAKAARFPAAKDDNLPGPGTFNPRSPESRKKGAFLEKEERFKQAKNDGIGAPRQLIHIDEAMLML